MYKTIDFKLPLCTHTKDKAPSPPQKCERNTRGGNMKTMHLLIFRGVLTLGQTKKLELLLQFPVLPFYTSAGNQNDRYGDTGDSSECKYVHI